MSVAASRGAFGDHLCNDQYEISCEAQEHFQKLASGAEIGGLRSSAFQKSLYLTHGFTLAVAGSGNITFTRRHRGQKLLGRHRRTTLAQSRTWRQVVSPPHLFIF